MHIYDIVGWIETYFFILLKKFIVQLTGEKSIFIETKYIHYVKFLDISHNTFKCL